MSRAKEGKGNREVERERGRKKERESSSPHNLHNFHKFPSSFSFFFAADEKCIKLISLDRVRVRGEESGRKTEGACVHVRVRAAYSFRISHLAYCKI